MKLQKLMMALLILGMTSGCRATSFSPVAEIKEQPSKVALYTKIILQSGLVLLCAWCTWNCVRLGSIVGANFEKSKSATIENIEKAQRERESRFARVGLPCEPLPKPEDIFQRQKTTAIRVGKIAGLVLTMPNIGMGVWCGWLAYKNIQRLREVYKEEKNGTPKPGYLKV